MAKGSDNPFPSVLVIEGSAPASPAAGEQRLFIDAADHTVKRVNSAGTVTAVEGSGGITSTRVNTTTAQTYSQATWRAVTFENEDFDDLSAHDTVTNPSRLTVPSTGRYRLTAGVGVSSCATFGIAVRKNGTTPAICQFLGPTGTADNEQDYMIDTGTLQLTSGDFLEVWAIVFMHSGSGSATLDTANIKVWACLDKLS